MILYGVNRVMQRYVNRKTMWMFKYCVVCMKLMYN